MIDDPDPDNEGEATMNEMVINAIKLRTPIWNMGDKLYKDCIHKKKLWVEIAYELEIDEDFVRKRWKNLRDKYFKALKKSKPKSGQAAVTQPSWEYMESMSFLSGVVEPRRTTTNMTGVSFNLSAMTSSPHRGSHHDTMEDVRVLATQSDTGNGAVELFSSNSSSTASQELSIPGTSGCNSNLQDHSTKSDYGRKLKRSRNVDSDPVEAAILSLAHDRQNVPAKKQELTSEEHFYLSVATDVRDYNATLRMRMRQAVLKAYVEIFLAEDAL